MDLINELDGQAYLFLNGIEEVGHGALRLVAEAGVVSMEAKDIKVGGTVVSGAREVSANALTPKYEIIFASYIAYAVRNESYVSQDKEESWMGKFLRVYSKSRFLDFVQRGTFASSEYPGPFAHYSLVCQDHVIDIATTAQPEVNRIR